MIALPRRKTAWLMPQFLALLLAGGCNGGEGSADLGAPDSALAADAAALTSASIGPAGGEAQSVDQKLKLKIPAGALDKTTTITIALAAPAPSGNLGPAYDIGPDGTKFLKPVTIEISY